MSNLIIWGKHKPQNTAEGNNKTQENQRKGFERKNKLKRPSPSAGFSVPFIRKNPVILYKMSFKLQRPGMSEENNQKMETKTEQTVKKKLKL